MDASLKTALFFLTCIVIIVFFAPLAGLALKASEGSTETFVFMSQFLLGRTAWNSFLLSITVGSGTFIIGTVTAWLVVRYNFWARRALEWLLILPLAFPAYIMAYTYTDFFDVAGPLQSALRDLTGLSAQDLRLPNIRSFSGAAAILILCL